MELLKLSLKSSIIGEDDIIITEHMKPLYLQGIVVINLLLKLLSATLSCTSCIFVFPTLL